MINPTGEETNFLRRPADGSRAAETVGSFKTRGYLEAIDKTESNLYAYQYALRSGLLLDIAKVPIGGGPATVIVGGQGSQFASAISPDGRLLAYQSDESTRSEIYVRELSGAGGYKQVSTTGGEEPHWSIGGTEILYRNDTRLMSTTVTAKPELRSTPPTMVFDGVYNLRTETGISYDIHPKTGQFLMIRPAGQAAGAPPPRVRVLMNWTEELKR